MSNWKRAERQAAKELGGKRVSRGDDFSQSKGDVDHPLWSIEVKYRKQIPKLITDGLRQAQGYAPDKTPLLLLKQRGMQGQVVCMKLRDFVDHFGGLHETAG